MADGLTITAGLVSAIATTTKVARAFKPSAADSKSRAKLFQFMETVAAINAIIATLPNLPTVQNEHLQRFTKETEVEVSDIAREMEGLMKKRNNGMSSSLRMPWIRRDLDKLQKRLDWLHAKVAQEFDEVHWDIQQ
jgi:phosphoglycerate-specific signal transduction histidine kinase